MIIDHKQTWNLWKTCKVNQENLTQIGYCATFILGHWMRYKTVGDTFGIPGNVVGCIHAREASFNFQTHLANGDPLVNKDGVAIPTIHVPKGLIADTWEEGAIKAFKQVGWDKGHHWDIVNALENLEAYNGMGYRSHSINSPYVWSMTDQYTEGKFASDGHFNPKLTDAQVGCAAILLALKGHGMDLNEIEPV